ncbi:putative transcription factor interactor and regulator CCHC(Zn) family protein [Tanacetum coccineum]
MAVGDDSGSNIELISNLDAGNPLYLQNNDNSSISLVNVKLVGAENYKMWATAVKIALKGKNKMGFIDGTCIKPIASTVMSQQWERCNAIVLGWILGSLSQELYVGQIYSEIASDVWTELKETYDKMDGSVVFNLMQRINNLKQDDLSVPDYYHKLNSLWREFDILTFCLLYWAIPADPVMTILRVTYPLLVCVSLNFISYGKNLASLIIAEDEVASDATQIGENVTSEGNTSQNQNGEGLSNVLGTSSPELRRSTRQKTMPVRFNDFVVNSSVRYGLEKYVCYANLSKSNLCFSTSLNKLSEPKSFQEAYQNPKWVEGAMNLENGKALLEKHL